MENSKFYSQILSISELVNIYFLVNCSFTKITKIIEAKQDVQLYKLGCVYIHVKSLIRLVYFLTFLDLKYYQIQKA